jgi:hypothetical protein
MQQQLIGCVAVLGLGLLGAPAPAQTNTALPEIEVRAAPLKEAQAVGPYEQPEWTTQRRFPTTRVYLQEDPGDFSIEGWWRGKWYKDGHNEQRFMEEIEIGLPHRFQLDVYHGWGSETGDDGSNAQNAWKNEFLSAEVRYALADWGKIPCNPTLYAEYTYNISAPDQVELKLLLGDQIGQNIHWGLNFAREEEIADPLHLEYEIAQAASYTLIDQKLSVGYEWQYSVESDTGDRANPEKSFGIGPSLQWRPTRNTHLDIVPLIGLSHDAPRIESFVVFGIDFGPESKAPAVLEPAALRGR